MKFNKIDATIDANQVSSCEGKFNNLMLELGLSKHNIHINMLGGG